MLTFNNAGTMSVLSEEHYGMVCSQSCSGFPAWTERPSDKYVWHVGVFFLIFFFPISELPGSLQDPAKGFYLMKMNLIDKCLLFAWTLSEFLHPSAEMLFPGQGEEPHHWMS